MQRTRGGQRDPRFNGFACTSGSRTASGCSVIKVGLPCKSCIVTTCSLLWFTTVPVLARPSPWAPSTQWCKTSFMCYLSTWLAPMVRACVLFPSSASGVLHL